jgi:uncharacterized protein involved in type VI secretion and phage assembly
VSPCFTRLADGSEARRSGLVRSAEKLGADGTLARYRLTLVPWLWLATQQRHSQVFQDRTLADIVGLLLSPYAPFQSWRFTANAQQRIDEIGARAHVSQYRETDYAFVAPAGRGRSRLCLRRRRAGARAAHADHFADSAALPEDSSGDVRYHRAHSQEEADAIQQLICHTRMSAPGIAVVAWDHGAKRSMRAHARHGLAAARSVPIRTCRSASPWSRTRPARSAWRHN